MSYERVRRLAAEYLLRGEAPTPHTLRWIETGDGTVSDHFERLAGLLSRVEREASEEIQGRWEEIIDDYTRLTAIAAAAKLWITRQDRGDELREAVRVYEQAEDRAGARS